MNRSFLFLFQQPTSADQPERLADVFLKLYADLILFLPGLLKALIVFTVFYIIAKIGKRFIALAAPRARADTGAVLLLSRVYYYSILTFGVLTALPYTGANVTALITGLGLTGFALGFAFKDVLSNLLSGIMLLVYRPFQIGDHIKMGEHEGTILTIRMRDTLLRAADGRTIVIPNTKLITEVVVNSSTAELVRESVQASVAANAEIGKARAAFLRGMEGHTSFTGRVEPQIAVTCGVDSGSTILEGSFWYDPRRMDKATARRTVTAAIRRQFEEVKVGVTFPSQVGVLQVSALPSEASDADEQEKANVKNPV